MTPCAVRRSIVGVESSATIRATGVPRSVMTTSVPSRAASIHRPRFARSSVTATSTTEVYITGGQQTYGGPTSRIRRGDCPVVHFLAIHLEHDNRTTTCKTFEPRAPGRAR